MTTNEKTVARRMAPLWSVVALAVILLLASLYNVYRFSKEQDERITANATLTCAIGEFSDELVQYFGESRDRVVQRIGTPNELSTDKASLESIDRLLGVAKNLSLALNIADCPVPKSAQ